MNSILRDRKFALLVVVVSVSIVLEVASLLQIRLPDPYSPFAYALLILLAGRSTVVKGFRALVKLKFGSVNLLMVIAMLGAFYLGEYSEAAVVILLYTLGERLEDIGIESSKSALKELIAKAPSVAVLKETNQAVPIENVPIGSVLVLKSGDAVPLDGIIVEGSASFDESTITGEPIPKLKVQGDTVYAGTINVSGFAELQVMKSANQTTLARIISMSYEAKANKSETQEFIQRFARIYTPSIIAISTLVFAVPVIVLGLDAQHWLMQAISLLVISCPCALVISTPVAIYSALGAASRRGVIIKGGKYVEMLARIRTIALDKTRTITYGRPIVSDIVPFGNTSLEHLLSCAAGAEVFSEHPLAQAIVDACRKEGYEPHKAEKYVHEPGKGASVTCLVCDSVPVYVGKASFIAESMPLPSYALDAIDKLALQGKTSVVVNSGDGASGVLGLTDEIKPDSLVAIQKLKALNVEPVMITGDSANAAEYVSKKLEIQKVYSDQLPEDKAIRISELRVSQGPVGMVGDGVNDAPALAHSDVGLAMGAAGSDVAMEIANVALMNDNLSMIPFVIRLSRETMRRIKINTIGAISIKGVFVTLALFGINNLVLAIAADVGVTLIVIILSLRLMKYE